jgi:catechol 2,3-dioxygenase-like lactoylglutathione lyase family enzyme
MAIRLHHVALRTHDVAALAAFYREMFALAVVRDAQPHSMWLALGGDAVLMIELRGDGEPAPSAKSLELVAFAVDSATRDVVSRKARERGCYDGETHFTVYLRDPEGRRLGISTYDFASAMP